jgi:hypothetical protein
MGVVMSMAVMAGVMMTSVMPAMVAAVMTSVVTTMMATVMPTMMSAVMASMASVAFRRHGDRQRESGGDRCENGEALQHSPHFASLWIFYSLCKRAAGCFDPVLGALLIDISHSGSAAARMLLSFPRPARVR